MTFTSTEGNGGPPIVLGKEPVDKPHIHCGGMSVGLDFVQTHHEDGSVTFSLPTNHGPDDYVVTYHRVPQSGEPCSRGMVSVVVFAEAVVTWAKIGSSN